MTTTPDQTSIGTAPRGRPMRAVSIVAALGLAHSVFAMDLALPGAVVLTAEDAPEISSATLPVGPWRGGEIKSIEPQGTLSRRAWRLGGSTATTQQLLDVVEAQLSDAGFQPVFRCKDRDCGGFDFRFALDIIGEPAMHVDLGDFRYLLARSAEGMRDRYVAVVVSRTRTDGYIHLTEIGEGPRFTAFSMPEPVETATAERRDADPPPTGDIAKDLDAQGHATIAGLIFGAGAAELENGYLPALAGLAAYLDANPAARIVLVGHTDNKGDLAANIALSRARAQSVARHLIDELGVDPAQVSAEGVGYLAPVATNTTDEGRQANRRVDVILAQ